MKLLLDAKLTFAEVVDFHASWQIWVQSAVRINSQGEESIPY